MIDIEAYTDIGVEESTGAIVLGPGPDAPPGFRKYYFRPEDGRHTRFRHHSRSSGGGEGSDGGEIVVSERGRCSGGAMREDDLELPVGEDEDVFEGDGGGFLGEWLSGFHRDRFKVVRDERDAYMNLQVQLNSWFLIVVVVSHIQRIGCQPEKTTLHGGQSRLWSAEQGEENKKKRIAAYPPPPHPPHCSFGKVNK